MHGLSGYSSHQITVCVCVFCFITFEGTDGCNITLIVLFSFRLCPTYLHRSYWPQPSSSFYVATMKYGTYSKPSLSTGLYAWLEKHNQNTVFTFCEDNWAP